MTESKPVGRKGRQEHNKQTLVRLYQEGKTLDKNANEIADVLGVSKAYAKHLYYAICREDPVSAEILQKGKRINKGNVDRKRLKELLESGVTIANIAKMFGVSRQAVHNWIKDIDYVRYSPFDVRKVKLKQQLRDLLKQDPYLTCQDLGEKLNISHVTVLNYLDEMGLKRQNVASAKRQANVKQALKMYAQGKKVSAIAKKLGVAPMTVSRYLHSQGDRI